MKTIVPPGVFRPRSDTLLLCEHVLDQAPWRQTVLELCAGSGAVSVTAARAGADVTAVDISLLATWTTRMNAWREGVHLEVERGNLYGPVADRRFDLIVANPPYVPTTHRRLPRTGPARAWDGGSGGRVVLDRIIDGLPRHLRPGGRALLVHSSLNDGDRTVEALRCAGLVVDGIDRRPGPLGPLMARQVDKGTIWADHEELLVLRASWPGPDGR